MKSKPVVILCALSILSSVMLAAGESLAKDDYIEKFHPTPAPRVIHHFLKANDRLAICGDSITEQRMYSRIMETYLTVCVPEMNVSVRQYGWSGERAPGFLARMTNDCLRFNPTIATTCYGMNDQEYRRYEDRIGKTYRDSSKAIVESFKAHGVRVVEGSSGCVGKKPKWSRDAGATMDDLNSNLCELRNIGIEIAKEEHTDYADVFLPMLEAGHEAQAKYGDSFHVCGDDGVHPKWAGHVVMAYAFLHSFGMDGGIGDFVVDMRSQKAKVSAGHELVGFKDGKLEITSHRYPFCIGDGDPSHDDNIRAGTMLVPFNPELNRFMLVVKHPKGNSCKITWGDKSRSFPSAQLAKGINLAEEFPVNPFTDAFNKVDAAVADKQAYETTQIKKVFHGSEGSADMEGAAARTEKEREPLVAAVHAAFVPVTHVIMITEE
jgi:lysophospholipase L1-like esterase